MLHDNHHKNLRAEQEGHKWSRYYRSKRFPFPLTAGPFAKWLTHKRERSFTHKLEYELKKDPEK